MVKRWLSVTCHILSLRTADFKTFRENTSLNLWEDTAEEGSNSSPEKLNSYIMIKSDPYEKRTEEDFN